MAKNVRKRGEESFSISARPPLSGQISPNFRSPRALEPRSNFRKYSFSRNNFRIDGRKTRFYVTLDTHVHTIDGALSISIIYNRYDTIHLVSAGRFDIDSFFFFFQSGSTDTRLFMFEIIIIAFTRRRRGAAVSITSMRTTRARVKFVFAMRHNPTSPFSLTYSVGEKESSNKRKNNRKMWVRNDNSLQRLATAST